jgi:D-glycero-beta-D-manno-heptose-7-phosphate kinase
MDILVVGDFMIDETIYGEVEKISPEAPVPIVNFKNTKYRLGGAGNVANNLYELGCNVSVLGICGHDDEGFFLENSLKKICNNQYILRDENNLTRITTKKTRIKSRNQQLLRIDYEDTHPFIYSDCFLEKFIKENKNKFDAIIISDYNKGVITRKLIEVIKCLDTKIFVDPKPNNWLLYDGVYLIKPNKREYAQIVEKYNEKIEYEYLLVTEGRDGMTLITDETSNNYIHFDATAKDIVDITGAGDTVIAVVAMLTSSEISIEKAVEISNICAGIVISREGTLPIRKRDLIEIVSGDFII